MKIQTNAEMTGKELADIMINSLSVNKINVPENPNILFNVQNKEGKWVEISLDKVKLIYNS